MAKSGEHGPDEMSDADIEAIVRREVGAQDQALGEERARLAKGGSKRGKKKEAMLGLVQASFKQMQGDLPAAVEILSESLEHLLATHPDEAHNRYLQAVLVDWLAELGAERHAEARRHIDAAVAFFAKLRPDYVYQDEVAKHRASVEKRLSA